MLWYSSKTDKAVSVMQEIKQMAVDIAVNQLRLAQYQIREIRPEDLPSPSTTDFTVTIAAGAASRVVLRRLQSNSLIIIAGFYCPDVKNNIRGILPTRVEGDEPLSDGQPFDVTLGDGGAPILKHVWFTRGTELIRRWPLCPVYADDDGAKVTEGYVIYYPDDVARIEFFAKDQDETIDQVSQTWYLGIALLPPGGTNATTNVT